MKKLAICLSLAMATIISAGDAAHAQQDTSTKKKMSSQGKGAIIGGAGGAVAGGLIGGDVKGALIGGALGAGGGYIIGNEKQKSKEKKEQAKKDSIKNKQ
jgi:uncharacterized protein YcfJ